MEEKKVKRFGDLEIRWEDVQEFIAVEDLLEKEIIVEDVMKLKGEYGEYVMVKFSFEDNADKYAFVTGGVVLMKRILYAKEKDLLPLPGTIKRVKSYYVIE